jgi:hypothetical protein
MAKTYKLDLDPKDGKIAVVQPENRHVVAAFQFDDEAKKFLSFIAAGNRGFEGFVPAFFTAPKRTLERYQWKKAA